MRFLRSIALCALALCASAIMTMPVAASVPIDPGIHVMAPIKADYPAPAIATVDRAALTCEAPTGTFRVFTRSFQRADSLHLASTDGSRSSFLDLRRRC